MKLNIVYLSAFLGSILFVACKKYEDGPAISLRSKKERVANTWKIKQAFRNGNDVTAEFTAYTLTLAKDGDAALLANYQIFGASYQYDTDGTWSFKNDNKHIVFDYQNNNADNEYQILRLKEDELWLREVRGEDEVHLQPK